MIPREPRYPTTSIPEYTNPPKPQENDLNFNHIKTLEVIKVGMCKSLKETQENTIKGRIQKRSD